MNATYQEKVTLDATDKRIGRLASHIADILNGKNTPSYAPNKVPNVTVEVDNVSQMRIEEKKKAGKIYDRYTGYFGGRREVSLGQVIAKKGYAEVLRRAVYGMLPGNRLRAVKMKKIKNKRVI